MEKNPWKRNNLKTINILVQWTLFQSMSWILKWFHSNVCESLTKAAVSRTFFTTISSSLTLFCQSFLVFSVNHRLCGYFLRQPKQFLVHQAMWNHHVNSESQTSPRVAKFERVSLESFFNEHIGFKARTAGISPDYIQHSDHFRL